MSLEELLLAQRYTFFYFVLQRRPINPMFYYLRIQIHDMFNWLTVIVLFTVEIVCRKYFYVIHFSVGFAINCFQFAISEPIFGVGYLEWLSSAIVNGVNSSSGEGEVKILTVVTDPFVDLIIQVRRFSSC